jgi:hypothetical protein
LCRYAALFPCGHTFCALCLTAHVETHGKEKCPYCRADIASQALNMSLQQIIQNFVTARWGCTSSRIQLTHRA